MSRLYIISGWCDTTGRSPYQRISEIAKQKGYQVVKVNPEWDEPLSRQIFQTTRHDVIFGFSMGAILACMVGKQYPYKKLILASMTPVRDLSRPTLNILGRKISQDCSKFQYGGVRATYFYGDREIDRSLDRIKQFAKIKIIPNTCHQLNAAYIEQIANEL